MGGPWNYLNIQTNMIMRQEKLLLIKLLQLLLFFIYVAKNIQNDKGFI